MITERPEAAKFRELRSKYEDVRKVYKDAEDELKTASKKADKELTALIEKVYPTPPKEFSPEELEEITQLAFSNTGAHNLVDAWIASFGCKELARGGFRYKGEPYKSGMYPSLRFTMSKGQEVKHLYAPVKRFIKCVGHSPIYMDIFENGLSEYAVYLVKFEDGQWSVAQLRYSNETEIMHGTLPEVLRWVADNKWYGDPHSDRYDYDFD